MILGGRPPRWVLFSTPFSFLRMLEILSTHFLKFECSDAPDSQTSRYAIYSTTPPICSSNPKKFSTIHPSLTLIVPVSSPAKNFTHTQTIKPHPHKRNTNPNNINNHKHQRSCHELRAKDPIQHQMPPQMPSPHRSRKTHNSIIRHMPTQCRDHTP